MLAKKYRLISERDFNQVYRGGKYIKGSFIYLKAKSGSRDFPRLGFLISNRLSKKSTVRNLLKRRARAAIKKNLAKIMPADIVVGFFRLPRPFPQTDEIGREIVSLLSKANLIKK